MMAKKTEVMKAMVWFPLFTEAWLLDRELEKCSLGAQGLLLRLMCHAWSTAGVMEMDMDDLLLMGGREPEDVILGYYKELLRWSRIIVSGDIHTGRVTLSIKRMRQEAQSVYSKKKEEWEDPKTYARKKSAQGREGAAKRWAKESNSVSDNEARRQLDALTGEVD